MTDPVIRHLDWTPELVGRFWDGVARTRGLAQQSFGRLGGRHLLQAVRWHLRPGRRHLDFGGGDGDFAALLAEAGYPVAVYEPSAERAARVTTRLGGRPGFLGTIGGRDVRDEAVEPFDAIFLVEVIEHVLEADLPALLARLDQLLAPGGLLIVTTPNGEDLEENFTYEPAQGVLFHRWQHQRSFVRGTLSALLGSRGFVPRVVHEVELTDRIFASSGAGLGCRPEYANLFNTDRPLTVGDGQSLVWIGGRAGEIEPEDSEDGALQRWRLARLELRTETRLVLPVPFGAELRPLPSEQALPSCLRPDVAELPLPPESMAPGEGWLYRVFLPGIPGGETLPPSDSEAEQGVSWVELLEDDAALGPAHSRHDQIGTQGRGRYSHWGQGVFFAASDNSDPRRNGRRYSLRWTPSPPKPGVRARFLVPVEAMQADGGRAFRVDLPAGLPPGDSDADERKSTLRLYEEHLLLGPPHSALEHVGGLGRGRYCQRGSVLYFSASDDSDPRSNGRRYILDWP